jgi:hypothetical protein
MLSLAEPMAALAKVDRCKSRSSLKASGRWLENHKRQKE